MELCSILGLKLFSNLQLFVHFLKKILYCQLENLLHGIEWEVNDWKKSEESDNLCLNESKHNKYDKQVE